MRVAPVVLAEGVAARLDERSEGVEAGLAGVDREDDTVRAGFEGQRTDPDLDAITEEPDGSRLLDRRCDDHLDFNVLADARRGRRRQALDDHLVGGAEPDLEGLDLDAPRRSQR